jgi:hypothetical protein
MTRRADPPDPSDAQAAAAYIGELSASLAMLARNCGLDTLALVLDMAREEADIILRAGERPQGDQ